MEYVNYNITEIAESISSGGDAAKFYCVDSPTEEYNIPVYANATVNEGLYGYTNRSVIHKAAVTIAARGAGVGFVAYRKPDFVPIVRLISIVPNDKADVKYLYFYLKTHNIVGGGAAIPQLTVPMVQKIKVQLPNIFYQQKIASILSTYDTLIENNTKRIHLLEQMAENLYKEWFVRFRFPGYEKEEMENGLPKGWKEENLFDIANVSYGYAFKSNLFCEDNSQNPVVRIRDIQDNATNTYTSEDCPEKYLIEENAILIGMDGLFHMCLWNGDKAYLNQRVVKLNTTSEYFCNYFLYMSIRPQVKFWEQVISGTTVAHLGDKHLKKMKVIVPTDDILRKANTIINDIMIEKNKLFKQNKFLVQQRDLLLPRLMSGKLEVKS